jgi:AraC-like DNA-binding protein
VSLGYNCAHPVDRSDLFIAYYDQHFCTTVASSAQTCFYSRMTPIEELGRNILRHAPNGTTDSLIEGLRLIRVDAPKPVRGKVIYKPMVCVIAQGSKTIALGDSRLRYGPSNYLLSALDLPITGIVRNASLDQPYLSVSLAIDQQMLSEVLLTLSISGAALKYERGLSVGVLDAGLLDCFVRLTRLLDTPDYISSISPLIKRELLCRLILGGHGHLLQQSASLGAEIAPVTQVIRWIRSHYAKPFSVAELASMAGMSPPSLHRHFRSVTSMSPLQYQKQIRLQEARRLLFSEGRDAATAAFEVGYASPSQFSREYHRAFGKPPKQDAVYAVDRQLSSLG